MVEDWTGNCQSSIPKTGFPSLATIHQILSHMIFAQEEEEDLIHGISNERINGDEKVESPGHQRCAADSPRRSTH